MQGGGNSIKTTKQVEKTRKLVAEFIGAESEENILFTAGATYSSNTIAYSYCMHNLEDGDEILLCNGDHKSTIAPFYNISEILRNFGRNIIVNEFPIDIEGDYNEEEIFKKINEKTKIVVLTHIHNTYGLEMNIEYITENIRKINKDVKIILDACQSVGHIEVDVKKLDVDMMFFSGHKMMAMQGVGVLYIRDDITKFKPFMVGGNARKTDMQSKEISNVRELENGTLNTLAILSLQDAIKFINTQKVENISKKTHDITRYLYDKLKEFPNIVFSKGIDKCTCILGYGTISFLIEGFNSSEIGDILKDYNIIVRTGDFCRAEDGDDFIRVSLYYYNTKEEIDRFIKVLNSIIELK